MATKTFEELKQLAIQIRDEKTNKQNTATRVGTAMLEHINKLEQDYYDKTKTDEELKERDDKLTELNLRISDSDIKFIDNVFSGLFINPEKIVTEEKGLMKASDYSHDNDYAYFHTIENSDESGSNYTLVRCKLSTRLDFRYYTNVLLKTKSGKIIRNQPIHHPTDELIIAIPAQCVLNICTVNDTVEIIQAKDFNNKYFGFSKILNKINNILASNSYFFEELTSGLQEGYVDNTDKFAGQVIDLSIVNDKRFKTITIDVDLDCDYIIRGLGGDDSSSKLYSLIDKNNALIKGMTSIANVNAIDTPAIITPPLNSKKLVCNFLMREDYKPSLKKIKRDRNGILELKDITSETIDSGNVNITGVGDWYYYLPTNELRVVSSYTSGNNFAINSVSLNKFYLYKFKDKIYTTDGTKLIQLSSQTNIANLQNYLSFVDRKYKQFKGYADHSTSLPALSNKGDYYIVSENSESISIFNTETAYNSVLYYDGEKFISEKIPVIKDYEMPQVKLYDVCIVGGGAGGIGAAFALRKSGLKVCLIERESCLGGTHINAYIQEWLPTPAPPFVKELFDKYRSIFTLASSAGGDYNKSLYYNAKTAKRVGEIQYDRLKLSNVYYDELVNYIDLYFNTKLIGANYKNKLCNYIEVKNTLTGGETKIYAKKWIDASGELCKIANGEENVGWYIGSDGKDRFNEDFYSAEEEPNRYEINVLEIAYRMSPDPTQSENLSKVQDIPGVGVAVNNLFKDLSNTEYRLQSTSTGSGLSKQRYVDEGYDSSYIQGLTNVMCCWKKTKENKKYNTFKFDRPAPMLGIREGHRIICDNMMVQSDLNVRVTSSTDIVAKKTIALSTWYVDIHGRPESKNIPCDCCGIPYTSLIPKNLKNVLVACDHLGASHIATAQIRLTKTMMSVGNAAGYAMIDCINKEDVRDADIEFIQEKIKLKELISIMETLYE